MRRRTSICHELSNLFATRRTKTKRESIEDFNAAKREENKNDKRETIRVHTLINIKRNNRYHISKYHRIKLEHVVTTRTSLHLHLLLLHQYLRPQRQRQLGFARQLLPHERLSFHFRDPETFVQLCQNHLHDQLVAWDYRSAEFHAVDAGEEELLLRAPC